MDDRRWTILTSDYLHARQRQSMAWNFVYAVRYDQVGILNTRRGDMKHPFTSIQPQRQRGRLLWLVVTTLGVMVCLNLVSGPLVTPASPQGIISFELAGSSERAAQILASWSENTRLRAAFGLGFDYLFMLAYSTTLSLACVMAGGVLRDRALPLASLGIPLAWGQWLAALFDAIENVALTAILFNQPIDPWPRLAQICASLKFVLIFLGLVYAFLGLIFHLQAPRAKAG
jgi:hypothetical protein